MTGRGYGRSVSLHATPQTMAVTRWRAVCKCRWCTGLSNAKRACLLIFSALVFSFRKTWASRRPPLSDSGSFCSELRGFPYAKIASIKVPTSECYAGQSHSREKRQSQGFKLLPPNSGNSMSID